MDQLLPILEGVRNTPLEVLLLIVVLSAFGLAAFTIHAILVAIKKKDSI